METYLEFLVVSKSHGNDRKIGFHNVSSITHHTNLKHLIGKFGPPEHLLVLFTSSNIRECHLLHGI